MLCNELFLRINYVILKESGDKGGLNTNLHKEEISRNSSVREKEDEEEEQWG